MDENREVQTESQKVNEARQEMDRQGKRRTNYENADEDCVLEASLESFPASDPPGWTGGITGPDDPA